MVRDALDAVPDEFIDQLENVAISVEDYPDRDDLIAVGLDPETDFDDLLGLYVGYPKIDQGHWDLVMPDKISIYRHALCDHASDLEDLATQVKKTVLHELGHYFGLSDERLGELGWH
ncbi:MAG: hypothetical protein DCC49_05545 [Acidobacteria bacterium]|nr:MAG: hypothetical protein DCC49_05545 [Acidobacteriota bacterium]